MRSSKSLLIRLAITFFATLAGMFVYEAIKQFAWPDIGIWQSHIITMFVSSGLSVACAYFVFRRADWMQQRIVEELGERQRAEAELRSSEEDLRITLDSIGDAVISTDAEGRVRRMNPVAERLTGWTLSDARAKNLTEVFKIRSEETGEVVENPAEKVLREGVVVGLANHTELICRTGGAVPIADSGAPIRDAAGKIVGVVLVFRDQTAEREAEGALRKSAGLMNALITNLPLELWAKSRDGKYVLQNPASQRAWGDQLGKDDSGQVNVSPEVSAQWKAVNQRAFTGEVVQSEWQRDDSNGPRVIQEIVAPIYDGTEIRGILGVNVDVTEQRRADSARVLASEALRQSEERFQLVIQGANDGIWDRNLVTNQVFFSDRYLELVGYARTEITKPFLEITEYLHPEDRARVLQSIDAHLKQRAPYDVEYRIRTKSNGYRWFRSRGQAIWAADGTPLRMAGSISDISDRKLMDEALRESEDRFRRLADAPFEGICISDEGTIVDTNNQFAQLLGYASPQNLIGKIVDDVVAPHSRETVKKNIADTSEYPYENWLLRQDGTTFLVESRARYLPYRGRKMRVTVFRDITERKLSEEKLLAYQQQLQSLSSRLLLIEERERRNFSQLLHDHIGQNLTYAKLRLGVLRTQVTDGGVLEPIQEVLGLIEQMSQETRSLTYELSPPLLYEIGLDAALEWLCEHFEARYNLNCTFKGSDEPERLEIDARIVLFQATRELLFNVVKHAKATHAEVTTVRSDGRVRLSTRDNGIGMNAAKPAEAASAGFGLFSVRERLQHIGGVLHIEGQQQGGTCVTLILPIKQSISQS